MSQQDSIEPTIRDDSRARLSATAQSALARSIAAIFTLSYLIAFGRQMPAQAFGLFAFVDSLRIFFCNVPASSAAQGLIKSARYNGNPQASLVAGAAIFGGLLLLPSLAFYSLTITPLEISILDSLPLFSIIIWMASILFYFFARATLLAEQRYAWVAFAEGMMLIAFVTILTVGPGDTMTLNRGLLILTVCHGIGAIPAMVSISFTGVSNWKRTVNPFGELRYQLAFLLPSLPTGLAGTLFAIVDAPIVIFTMGPIAAATYKAGRVFMNAFAMLAEAGHLAFYPAVAGFGSADIEKAVRMMGRYLTILLPIAIVGSIVLVIFAEPIMRIVYSDRYSVTSLEPFLILLAVWGPIFITARMVASLVSGLGFPALVLLPALLSGAIGVFAMTVLIGSYGFTAIGIGFLVSALTGLLLVLRSIRIIANNPTRR